MTWFCNGCGYLEIEPPARQDAYWLCHCCDPDKPVHGARRVIYATRLEPAYVPRPGYCRGKKETPPTKRQFVSGGEDEGETSSVSLRLTPSPCAGKAERKVQKSCEVIIPHRAGNDKENFE